jgi:ATP-dependent DNA ligase
MLLPDGLDRPALPTVQTRRENDAMDLPVMPPVSPMLSKSVASLPPDASYEPKWDGFIH